MKLKYGLGNSLPVGGGVGMGGACDGEACGGGLEEGFLDASALKEVALCCRENDLLTIARRYGNSLTIILFSYGVCGILMLNFVTLC